MTEIEDEELVGKILGQFQLALNGIMKPLRLYGHGEYVDGVSSETLKLAWQMHWRLEGIDMPYEITNIHW